MYAQLGDIIFDALLGPDQYDDTQETEYAQVPLINSKPRLQRVGETLNEINLSILLHSAFCIPEIVYQQLKDKRANGEILTFSWGSGEVEGDFVIRSVKRVVNSIAPTGDHRDVTLQIALIEYFDPDKISTLKKSAVRGAFATTLDAPTVKNVQVDEPSDASSVMTDVGAADSNINNLNGKMNKAVDDTNGYSDVINKAQAFVSKVRSDSFQLKSLIRITQGILATIGVKLAANPALTAIAGTLTGQINAANITMTAAQTVVNGYSSLPDPVNTITDANQVLEVMNSTATSTKDLETANQNIKKAAQPLAIAVVARKEI